MGQPRVGFSTMLGSQNMEELPGQLDLIQSFGAEAAEISALHDDLIAGYRLLPGRMALLKSMLADRPLEYSVHAAIGINFMAPRAQVEAHLDVTKAYLELSAEIGATNVVIHTGMYPGQTTQSELDRLYEQQREYLVKAGDVAGGANLLLCVENVFYWQNTHTATPSELAQELALIDHPSVCATFDFGHAALNLEDDGDLFVSEAAHLTPHSKHLHIHDNFAKRNLTQCYTANEELAFGEGDLHLPLHWGSLPWDALADLEYPSDPLFMIELSQPFWREGQQMVDDTRAWAKKVCG